MIRVLNKQSYLTAVSAENVELIGFQQSQYVPKSSDGAIEEEEGSGE